MVTIALFDVTTTYVGALALLVKITVSSPSTNASATGVMVPVALACPAGMITEKPMSTKSAPRSEERRVGKETCNGNGIGQERVKVNTQLTAAAPPALGAVA